MNATQQKSHTTRVDDVEQAVARFADAALRKIGELEADVARHQARFEKVMEWLLGEQTDRLTRTTALRAHVDAEDHNTRVALAAFTAMGFWARLRWVVAGR